MPQRVAIGWTPTRSSSPLAAPISARACSAAWGVAGSLSKTAAVHRAGGTSQVSGLSAAAIAIVAILLVAPVLSILPKAVLSAIVVNAVWGLLDLAAIRRYMKVRRNNAIAALVAAGGVLIAGPMLGLAIAIGQSLLGMAYRSSRVDVEILGIPGVKAAWGGVREHPDRTTIPGILGPGQHVAVWVNATEIQEKILQAVDAAPDTKALILNLESTDQLETTSADMLSELREPLAERNVDLYLVRVRLQARTVLAHSGLRARLGKDHHGTTSPRGYGRPAGSTGLSVPGNHNPSRSWKRRRKRASRRQHSRRAVERSASPPTLKSSGWRDPNS